MGIEDFKRWHWIFIGLIAGLTMGYVWTNVDSTGDGLKVNQSEFEGDLGRKAPITGEPILRNIVIHPPMKDYQTPPKDVQLVTFKKLYQGAKTGKTYYQSAQFIATIPYKPDVRNFRATKPNYEVKDFLDDFTKANPTTAMKFSYGWWYEKPMALAIWTIGAVVVVGGVWPTLLNLMMGAGFGPKREKKDEYDLSRFGKGKSAKAPTPHAPVVSEAERSRLDAMNAKLEADLQAAGVLETEAPQDEDPEGKIMPSSIRKLDGGVVEPTAAAKKPGDDDEIEVKGEFYPVLIHHKKDEKKDEKKP